MTSVKLDFRNFANVNKKVALRTETSKKSQ